MVFLLTYFKLASTPLSIVVYIVHTVSFESAYLLWQRGPRVWTGVMQVGLMMGQFNTPLSILDLPVASSCSLTSAVTDQKIRTATTLMPSASPLKRPVSSEFSSYQSILILFPDRRKQEGGPNQLSSSQRPK